MSTAAGPGTLVHSGVLVRDRTITVPVDWAAPERLGTIEVFAREIVDPSRDSEDLPLLLFLQGGPGGASPRPGGSGWWTAALKDYRVVLLDQRGTGRSAPVHAGTAAAFGHGVEGATALADYLACFRADAIVRDAEHLRRTVYGGRTWTTLGQSYGGFCTLVYLATAPEALDGCMVTGGLVGITATAEDVYRATYARQETRNAQFRARVPRDGELLDAFADQLAAEPVRLPDGDLLTVERLATLGWSFGMSSGFRDLHWALDTSGLDAVGGPQPTPGFLEWVAAQTSFATNPLYIALHEPIYHQGFREPGWVAQAERDRRPAWSPSTRPLMLTGEMVYPWMLRDHWALRPLAGAAEELANRTEWPVLYDVERLASNEVPVAAVQYVDDPYVDLDLALGTADRVGAMDVWVTNEFLHDGLRTSGEIILPRLRALLDGTWQLPTA